VLDPDVAIVGHIDSGLPTLGLPDLGWHDAGSLAAGGIAVMLVGFAEGLGAAKNYAARQHQEIDANRELLGLGGANLASTLSSGMVVEGRGWDRHDVASPVRGGGAAAPRAAPLGARVRRIAFVVGCACPSPRGAGSANLHATATRYRRSINQDAHRRTERDSSRGNPSPVFARSPVLVVFRGACVADRRDHIDTVALAWFRPGLLMKRSLTT